MSHGCDTPSTISGIANWIVFVMREAHQQLSDSSMDVQSFHLRDDAISPGFPHPLNIHPEGSWTWESFNLLLFDLVHLDQTFLCYIVINMSASYWTPKTKSSLRQLAARLEKTQFDGVVYDPLSRFNSNAESYVLTPYHELKLANDIAYLACTEEGVRKISAVCVEESRSSLTILVASNEIPTPETVASLQKIGNAISSYASRGKSIFQTQRVCPM